MWHVEDVGDVILIFVECNGIYVKDVEDRSNTPKGCNAMYVEDVEDGKITYTHILAHNFLNIKPIVNPQKLWEAKTYGFPTIPSSTVYIKACQICHNSKF